MKVIQRFLTRENIVSVFQEAGVPPVFDFMGIDTDGNDYWLWEAIGKVFAPRVVVIEYNASFGPCLDWVMPYNPEHRYDETIYFGATLKSLVELGSRLEYELVGCSADGVNAFFVKRELINDLFERVGSQLSHYIAPHYGAGFGHPVTWP